MKKNAGREGEPKITHQMTLADFDRMFPDETACKTYLMMQRWPNGVACPRCGNTKLYKAGAKRPFHWQCFQCGANKRASYRFSVTAGTVFENTNYKLLIWFKVLYFMLTSKKGISALQIHRMVGTGSYRTAWYMCHRLRAGLADPDFRKLMGIVEVDETFFGGKAANMHAKRRKAAALMGTKGKVPVIGAISRKGNVVCQLIENTDTPTLDRFVRRTVSNNVSLIATDEHSGYRLLGNTYKHEAVRHGAGEYVRGGVHTANIDSFWSLLKRGVVGTYHNVSKKYLPLI